MLSESEKLVKRAHNLQKKMEFAAVCQLHHFKRYGRNSEKIDKDICRYSEVLVEIRKDQAARKAVGFD